MQKMWMQRLTMFTLVTLALVIAGCERANQRRDRKRAPPLVRLTDQVSINSDDIDGVVDKLKRSRKPACG
jgi:hypothetical protein